MVVVPFLVETPRVQRMSAERTLASLGLVLRPQMIPIGKRSSKFSNLTLPTVTVPSTLIGSFFRPTNTSPHCFSILFIFVSPPVLGFLSRLYLLADNSRTCRTKLYPYLLDDAHGFVLVICGSRARTTRRPRSMTSQPSSLRPQIPDPVKFK